MRFATVVFIVLGVGAGAVVLCAQAPRPGAPATILQMADSAVPGYEVVAARAGFEPGAATAWHTHPGEMVGYVLEGSLLIEQQGKPPMTLKAGEAFIVAAGIAHRHTNVARTRARMHATYVVRKGEHLASPAIY